MITINGIPKSGTHALEKAIQLLGIGETQIIHDSSYAGDEPCVYIYRNPRNCLISMCRFQGKPVASGFLINLIRNYSGNKSLKRWFAEFASFYWAYPLTLHYEELVQSPDALIKLASQLKVPYLEDAFPNLPGLTATWTGAPSQWEDHWDSNINDVYVSEGMLDLEIQLGYLNIWPKS